MTEEMNSPDQAPPENPRSVSPEGEPLSHEVETEELPPEPAEREPPGKVLEEAYFHINNGGTTFRLVERTRDPDKYPDSHELTLEVHASHFGRGLHVEIPMLGRAMVSYLAEAMARTAKHLESSPGVKLHGPFEEPDPHYKVVKGTPLPRRIVRHNVSGPNFAMCYSENTTAQVASEVLRESEPTESMPDTAAQKTEAVERLAQGMNAPSSGQKAPDPGAGG